MKKIQTRRLRHVALVLGPMLLLASTPAIAGWFGKSKAPPSPPDPVAEPESVPPPTAPAPPSTKLWTAPLPHPLGALPDGLANASAQGCAACHGDLHDDWSSSAHARGPSPALLEAAADANEDRCTSCHLPLDVQHRQAVVLDAGDPTRPKRFDNPGFDATLAAEGATCAACHIRDGKVLGSAPVTSAAPHAGGWSDSLGSAQSCAPCHQLTWPGADRPLYDTVGEWERSAYAEADISCATCHLEGSAGHTMSVPASRAVSILTQLPPAAIVRGAEPVEGVLIVQNTGAGHAFPTGSPWRGVRIQSQIEGPKPKGEGTQPWGDTLTADLRRSLSESPPWSTVADTRLAAGAQQRWPLSLRLPVDAPKGAYVLRTTLSWTRVVDREVQVQGAPFIDRQTRLIVQ